MPDISELDATAQRLRVTWQKAGNYWASLATLYHEMRDHDFSSYTANGSWAGVQWTFERWLLAKCGLSPSFVLNLLNTHYRHIAAEDRARAKVEAEALAQTKREAAARAKLQRLQARASKMGCSIEGLKRYDAERHAERAALKGDRKKAKLARAVIASKLVKHPKTQAARLLLREFIEAGKPFDRAVIAKQLGVSTMAVQLALAAERGRQEALQEMQRRAA